MNDLNESFLKHMFASNPDARRQYNEFSASQLGNSDGQLVTTTDITTDPSNDPNVEGLVDSMKGLDSPAKAKALQSPDKERPAQKRNSQGTPSGVHRLP